MRRTSLSMSGKTQRLQGRGKSRGFLRGRFLSVIDSCSYPFPQDPPLFSHMTMGRGGIFLLEVCLHELFKCHFPVGHDGQSAQPQHFLFKSRVCRAACRCFILIRGTGNDFLRISSEFEDFTGEFVPAGFAFAGQMEGANKLCVIVFPVGLSLRQECS